MFHKAINLELKEGTSLEVKFQDGLVKQYDVAVLFDKYPQLEKLRDRTLFIQARLMGSYGIVWNDELDLEVETVYEDGVAVRVERVPLNMKLGNEIMTARNRLGLTQRELALATGIDQSDISKIERGVANPSITTIERIADKLCTDITISLQKKD